MASLEKFFELLDARPFRPFKVDLLNGKMVAIGHPDNVHLFPSRKIVREILVYYPQPDTYSVIFPEGINALQVWDDDPEGLTR